MLDFPQILLEEWAVFHPKNSINIIFFFPFSFFQYFFSLKFLLKLSLPIKKKMGWCQATVMYMV